MKAEKGKKFQTIGLFGRTRLSKNKAFLNTLRAYFEKKGCTLLWDSNLTSVFGESGEHARAFILKKADMVVTLGGDGTILKAVRDLPKRKDLLFFGVNLGNVGFLTEAKPNKTIERLEDIFAGNFYIDERLLLRCTLYREGEKLSTHLALNDIVINQGSFARLIKLRAELDQRKMIDLLADGVIFASPTGSTGHSLSAGGPIIHPKIDAFIFTPICPAELSVRPVVIPSNRQVTITIETERKFVDNKIGLTIDGQIVLPVEYGDQIKVRKSTRKLRFIRKTSTGGSYYRLLREKLNWGK